MDTILHGEAMLVRVKEVPSGFEKIEAKGYKIIAPSETTGNHHIIDVIDGVEFYEKAGKLYLKNDTETQVRCVVADRHDAVIIPCGIWEIDIQQEYDHFAQRAERVRD
jgi:hypothetical protein